LPLPCRLRLPLRGRQQSESQRGSQEPTAYAYGKFHAFS
jgi:hypothetical protein